MTEPLMTPIDMRIGHGWKCVLCGIEVSMAGIGHVCHAEARIREIIREELQRHAQQHEGSRNG